MANMTLNSVIEILLTILIFNKSKSNVKTTTTSIATRLVKTKN